MENVLLRTEKLTRILQGEIFVTLVNNADITIKAGEFVAVTGPSGSGKSSLLYLLGLLDKPTSGHVFLNGQNTSTATEHARAHMRLSQLGFVFQFHFLLPEFTALENVMLPMQRLGQTTPKQQRERAEHLLVELGLKEQIHKAPHQMSGGQSQRVAIARALANKPGIILADEPTGNLDSVSSGNVQQIFRNLTREENCAVIVVTHDEDFSRRALETEVIHRLTDNGQNGEQRTRRA